MKLLEPLTSSSLPSHGHGMRVERTHHLWLPGAPKMCPLPTLLLLRCSAGYWGECGLPRFREGWISKMDDRCSHESQVGVFKKKFHSMVESTESQTVCVQRASSKHPISASKSSAQRVLFLTMPSKLTLQVIRLEKSDTCRNTHYCKVHLLPSKCDTF